MASDGRFILEYKRLLSTEARQRRTTSCAGISAAPLGPQYQPAPRQQRAV